MCFMSPEQMQQVGMQASSVLPILLGRLMQGAPGGPQGALPPGQAPGMGMIPPGSAMGGMTNPMGPPGAGPPGPASPFPPHRAHPVCLQAYRPVRVPAARPPRSRCPAPPARCRHPRWGRGLGRCRCGLRARVTRPLWIIVADALRPAHRQRPA